jgi:hypothetical protein
MFLTALAVLDLLAESAARAPVLAVADDVQWLDRPPRDVLAFVARRLEFEPALLVTAVRDGYESHQVRVHKPSGKLRIHQRFDLLPGLGLHHLLGPMPDPGSAQAPGSSPPTPAGARPILNASITHSPCVQRTRSWNGSARPSLTAFLSLTARRRRRACSVLTGHPSKECVPTGFLMPPRMDRRHW